MISARWSVWRRVAATIALAFAWPVLVVGCASDQETPSAAKVLGVGVWQGDYAFPTPDGELIASPLRLVVDKSDRRARWGFEEFADGGRKIRVPITGSVDRDGPRFGFAAEGLIISGTVTGRDRIHLRFYKTSVPATSFDVTLERVPSDR